jgi:hypothetical protein
MLLTALWADLGLNHNIRCKIKIWILHMPASLREIAQQIAAATGAPISSGTWFKIANRNPCRSATQSFPRGCGTKRRLPCLSRMKIKNPEEMTYEELRAYVIEQTKTAVRSARVLPPLGGPAVAIG